MESIVPFLKGLKINNTLESLDLSWNALCGEMFGKFLLQALKSCALKNLDLSVNSLRSFELQQLTEGLKKSQTLEEITIDRSIMSEDDALGLLRAFARSATLTTISFGEYYYASPVVEKVFVFNNKHNKKFSRKFYFSSLFNQFY